MGQALEAQSGTQTFASLEKLTSGVASVYSLAGGVVLGCLLFSLAPLPVLPLLLLSFVWGLVAVSIRKGRWLALGMLLACLAGVLQTWRVSGPELARSGQQAALATLKAVEPAGEVQRLHFYVETPKGAVPVRLTYGGDAPLNLGARYQVVFWAAPRSIPAYPGAYDSAYALHFQGVRTVGAAQKLVQMTPSTRTDWGWLRRHIDARVRTVLPGPEGAVASALMTGYRANLDSETRALFRDSGLAHLLAISGLHLSLVASAIFGLVRFGFWLRPGLTERVNPRRVATIVALAVTLFYFFLSGASIPTQRALVLIVLASLGLILGRHAISWRLWALALTVVLLVSPSAVFSISTHLSFLAVAILIRAAGWVEDWRRTRPDIGAFRAWAVGLVGTSVAVNFLTVPLLLTTFGRAPLYGVLANLVAVPLAGVALIPLALIALAVMPLGLDALPLMALGKVIEFLIWLASWVTDLPGNMLIWPQIPYSPLWLLLLGYGLFLAPRLMQRFQRAAGWGLICLCLGLPFISPQPQRLEHPDGWVLEKGLGGQLMNAGDEQISAYAFDQAKALWGSDQFPDKRSREGQGIRPSKATEDTGPVLIYQNWGREWTLPGNLTQRRQELRWWF